MLVETPDVKVVQRCNACSPCAESAGICGFRLSHGLFGTNQSSNCRAEDSGKDSEEACEAYLIEAVNLNY